MVERLKKRHSTLLETTARDRDQIFFKKFSLSHILQSEEPLAGRKTKIVCTIGPKCWDVETLCGMLDRGMTVARLNFSHGDHKMHGETLEKLREAFKLRKDKQCAIMLDTKGPEIRTGLLTEGKAITLKKGQDLEITTDYTFKGTNTKIACSYKSLPKSVKEGSQILIADGSLVCKVKKILEDGVVVEVLNDATIGEKKNMNLPGVIVDLPTITEKDEDDLVNFGLKYGVDMVAASFIRKASDVEHIRDVLGPRGAHILIISKIENQEGLENYDEILEASDGIMVARGDLGMEIPVQKVFIAQKWMIRKANLAAKPVITATQMMESMIKNPRPTRAEVSDVANAVLDGTDCVMLSGETANGDYPLAAVEIMADISAQAELCYDRSSNYETMKKLTVREQPEEAIASSAVQISHELDIKLIICLTETGKTARFLSKYSPNAQIIAISVDDHTIKGLCISRGVKCLKVPSFIGTDNLVEHAIKVGKEHLHLNSGDSILVIHGTQDGNPEQSNLLKIVQI